MIFENRSLLGFALCFLLLFTTCSDDNPVSVKEKPPQLPPVASMEMDFSAFNSSTASNANIAADALNNYKEAAARIFILKILVDAHLQFPRLMLEMINRTDAVNENGEWIWTYSFSHNGFDIEFKLVAAREGEKVNWAMYVSGSIFGAEGNLFFEGTTNQDATKGKWIYYSFFPFENSGPLSKVEWAVSSKDNVSLKFTLLIGKEGRGGSTIDYHFDGTVKRAIFYNSLKDMTTEIAWNVNTKAGYIIAPDYNNGVKSCWNSSLQNVSCSEINI